MEEESKNLILIYISLIILIPIILFQTYVGFYFGSWENKKVLDKIKEFHELIESNQSIPMEKFFIKEVRDVLDKEPFVNTSCGFESIFDAFSVLFNDSNSLTVEVSDEEKIKNRKNFIIEFKDSNNQEKIIVYDVTKEDGEFKFINVDFLKEELKEDYRIKYYPRRFRI